MSSTRNLITSRKKVSVLSWTARVTQLTREDRLRLAWTIISTCDQDRAVSLLDGKYTSHPWTELLQSSTVERTKLRTDKEKESGDKEGVEKSQEAREKFERRSRILDEVYKMIAHVEDYRSGGIGTYLLNAPVDLRIDTITHQTRLLLSHIATSLVTTRLLQNPLNLVGHLRVNMGGSKTQ